MYSNNNSIRNCVMCHYVSDCEEKLAKHINRYHRHDPSFRAACKACSYQSRSWTAWRKHRTRCEYKEEEFYDNVSTEFSSYFDDDFECPGQSTENDSFDFVLASFFLKLEAKHGLSQRCITVIVEELEALFTEVKDKVSDNFDKILRKKEIDNVNSAELFEDFNLDNILNKFGSDSKRKKFYESNFKMVIPQSVFINTDVKRINNRITRINNYGYYVPFLSSLKALLAMPEVSYWVLHNHKSNDDTFRDWCDGELLRNENLANTLLIILNVDDIETVNPIGMSKKIHKLIVVSYELANIPPQFRSSLHTKQLIAVCKSKFVRKSGTKNLLLDFVQSMNALKAGCIFKINGEKVLFKAILVATPADTPAANQLWGFKEGVAKAYRCCRTCDGIRPNIFTHFTEDAFSIRSTDEHLERCEIIAEASSPAVKADLCKKYGINSRSVLFDICGVTLNAAIHDPMHVLLEGIVLLELKAVLHNFIFIEKLFTIDWLNAEILCWNFSDITNKPPAFQMESLKDKGKLTLTASTIMSLLQVLPFIFSKKVSVNNAKFLNFLRVIKITHICTSPYADLTTASELSSLICKHHEVFVAEYPDISITPKFHYLTHFPRQLRNFGPLRHQWCMRWEAHFSVFKGRKWGSFKNIAFSMAWHHQQWICYHQLGIMGEKNPNYLYKGHIFESTEKIDVVSFPQDEQNSLNSSLDVHKDIWRAKEVAYHGCKYKAGLVLSKGDGFLLIDDVIVQDETIYFLVKQSVSSNFVNNLNAFQVEFNPARICIDINSISRKFPLKIYSYSSKKYVVNPYISRVYGE